MSTMESRILVLLLSLLLVHVRCYGGGGNHVSSGNSPSHNQHREPPAPSNGGQNSRLTQVFGWNQMDFVYPNNQARQEALRSGAFDPKTVVPIGVAAAGPRVFVTMPKWRRNGTPATLATVRFPSNSTSPPLEPYPSWQWHRPGDCEGITSVFRVKADECGRLWVLDNGVVDTFVRATRICPPQVHVFDLNNDQLIYRYRFPDAALKADSLLCTIEVEYPDSPCGGSAGVRGAVLHVADPTTFALIVADLRQQGTNNAWRIQDKTMYPSPEAGTFTVNRQSFEFMDGVLGLALSPINNQRERTLYYHSMSSFREFWVRTSVLRNSTEATNNPRAYFGTTDTRSSQAAGSSMDQNGVLFFGLVVNNAVGCWNTRKPFNQRNIANVAQNDQTLQFVSTVTVDPESRLWALSMRFQAVLLNTLSPREPNYRVFMSPSSAAAVRGTSCERGGNFQAPANQEVIFRP
ncbi:hypothetical protein B566_EDAN002206 [Ephemera danica]|nr:hypothetical protein B566_EDAN002206 [Ephemera danica]